MKFDFPFFYLNLTKNLVFCLNDTCLSNRSRCNNTISFEKITLHSYCRIRIKIFDNQIITQSPTELNKDLKIDFLQICVQFIQPNFVRKLR